MNAMPGDLKYEPQLIGVRASDVITKPVEWLWDKRIPKGKLTMFDGDPDVGKSVVTMDLAARVSTGRGFPDGAECEAGNVLIVNVEDAKDDTIVPRLKAHGADLERIVIVDGMPNGDGGTRLLDLPDDVEALKAAVEEYEAALLILDPVLTVLGGDSNKDQDARKALAPIRDMAEETGVTVVAVRHLNKNTSLSAIQRGGGNMGLIGVARAGAFFARHPEHDTLRIMAPHKSNLAEKQPSLQYVIRGWAIDENIGRVEWKGVAEHDANSLAADTRNPGEKSELDAAKEFLQAELEDGPMWSRQIFKDARDAGIAQKTLYRAKNVLRVKSEKEGTEGWSWHLPHEDGQKPPHDHLDHVDHVGHVPKPDNNTSPNSLYIKEGGQDGQDGQDGHTPIDDHLNGHLPLSAEEKSHSPLSSHLSDDETDRHIQRLVDEGRTEAEAIAGVIEQLEALRVIPGELEIWEKPRVRLQLEKLKRMQSHTNGSLSAEEKKGVIHMLTNPQPWFVRELNHYSTEPDRYRRPVCAAVAAKVLKDPGRWEEVVPILTGADQ